MMKYTTITLISSMLLISGLSHAHNNHMIPKKVKTINYVSLGETGHKTRIDNDLYAVYDFDKKPSMGSVIVRIQVFDNDGKRVTSLNITGDSGMPAMQGAHDSGDVVFKLNKKGVYLMPVNIVMPGDWEIKLKFMKEKKVIFYGVIKFDV